LNTHSTNISEGIVQFLYARVSSRIRRCHQLQQARAAGFDIDEDNVVKDEGVSGVSTCFAEREGGRRLVDKLRRGDVLVFVGLTA
jgi:putative DNA-invertase from lambdoid prophage Rac